MEDGLELLASALRSGVPVVAFLGQNVGWPSDSVDPVLTKAIEKAGRVGNAWSNLLTREPLDQSFYQWVAERFERRAPSEHLSVIADIPISAIFTSSIDPGIQNLFSTNGREPEPILLGNPIPTELRSLRRPPIFYLFGNAATGTVELNPPLTRQSLSQRRLHHSSAMLLNLMDSATALGLIIIDGYNSKADWLIGEDLLAAISDAPKKGVVWFGEDPAFEGEDAETFCDLINKSVITRCKQPLAEAYSFLRSAGEVLPLQHWDEPEIISLQADEKFVVSPRLRLLTEASASIVDNSWTGFLSPFTPASDTAAFHNFHGSNLGSRALVEGIRRGYALTRDFESDLYAKVEKAISKHHEQSGAIILHGQSGIGKTIALGRLAIKAREKAKVAVLIANSSRVPQPTDISPFLEAVGKHSAVTLLIADANGPVNRYDDLLSALRSGGHKVVVVGSSYKLEDKENRYIYAKPSLSPKEQSALLQLSEHYCSTKSLDVKTDHALAKFYWILPESRGGIAEGLSREVRTVETSLRLKGTKPRVRTELSTLGVALVAAGYSEPLDKFFTDELPTSSLDLDSPAGKVIDFVMAVSRLYKEVPVNLLLRTVLSHNNKNMGAVNLETIRDFFEGEDLFRWKSSGNDQSEILIGARLQIEAVLVCARRLGTPDAEAATIAELISNAYRAGPEDSEESHFVTDIVYALGPDGVAGERYKDSYLEIARCLSALRKKNGVLNARLMLQESALRRAYLRTHLELEPNEKAIILEEATHAVNDALNAIEMSGIGKLYAAKRTKEYLLTERAAIYGFLATESAQREENTNEVWTSYRAARDAAKLASGRVFSYQPIDISLWVPIRILKDSKHLNELQRAELQADIRSILDVIDPTMLPQDQAIIFNRQRIAASGVLQDSTLGDEAFLALEKAGSAVGFYLKARSLSPTRLAENELPSPADISAAEKTAAYLLSVFPKISNDSRSLQLLILMEWIKVTKRWLFRGFRQPLPFEQKSRSQIQYLLAALRDSNEDSFSPQFRYLSAVMTWLNSDPLAAMISWRELARDTEYVETFRVAKRHTITDANANPVLYDGIVIKSISSGRWTVRINELDREVDLQEADFPDTNIALGRTVRKFAISFSYRGPIADPFYRRGH